MLPPPNTTAGTTPGTEASKGSPAQRLVQSLAAPGIAALLRQRFGSLPVSSSEAAEPHREAIGEPPADASSSTVGAASTEDSRSGATVRVVRGMLRKRALAGEKTAAGNANSTGDQRSASL